jgi:lysophospholipase L1-like esterase
VRRFVFAACLVSLVTVSSLSTADVLPRLYKSGAAKPVLIIGDSVAHGAGGERGLGISGWIARFTGLPIVNRGVNGARTRNVRALLHGQLAQSQVRAASVIVLSIGGNDRISPLDHFHPASASYALIASRIAAGM